MIVLIVATQKEIASYCTRSFEDEVDVIDKKVEDESCILNHIKLVANEYLMKNELHHTIEECCKLIGVELAGFVATVEDRTAM